MVTRELFSLLWRRLLLGGKGMLFAFDYISTGIIKTSEVITPYLTRLFIFLVLTSFPLFYRLTTWRHY
jgi:hypothetical protein